MPLNATGLGYLTILWDEPDLDNSTNFKVGGRCVFGTATSSISLGGVVIHDTSADYSYTTTTSASATTGAGFYVAKLNPGSGQWDFQSDAASGDTILVLKEGRVKTIASTAISRGARVGTSTTASQVVTTTTQDASMGKAVTAATTQGDAIYIDVPF